MAKVILGVLEAGTGEDADLTRSTMAGVSDHPLRASNAGTNMENENQPNEEAPLVPPAVSQAASQLGRRGRGRPKTLTPEDRQRRSDQMTEINKRRVVRVQGIVVNGPRGNTTVQQPVKSQLVEPVTNPALVDSINRASKVPPPWPAEGRVARVQGRRVG